MINNNYQFITYWFTLHFFYFAFFFLVQIDILVLVQPISILYHILVS